MPVLDQSLEKEIILFANAFGNQVHFAEEKGEQNVMIATSLLKEWVVDLRKLAERAAELEGK